MRCNNIPSSYSVHSHFTVSSIYWFFDDSLNVASQPIFILFRFFFFGETTTKVSTIEISNMTRTLRNNSIHLRFVDTYTRELHCVPQPRNVNLSFDPMNINHGNGRAVTSSLIRNEDFHCVLSSFTWHLPYLMWFKRFTVYTICFDMRSKHFVVQIQTRWSLFLSLFFYIV